jgi:hypothetical protein
MIRQPRETDHDRAGAFTPEQILAKHGQRWRIEREGSVWTATEHPSPTSVHVLAAHDLDELERKIIKSELPRLSNAALNILTGVFRARLGLKRD